MNILITGGAGFVGSNLAIYLKSHYPEYSIFIFDNLKRRGSELNLPRFKEAGIKFIHGDIRNPEDFEQIEAPIDCLIEASAEPSVMAGINSSPGYLINTNLNGTINCLYFAKKHKSKIIFLSTSRIYPVEAINSIVFQETDTRFIIKDKQTLNGISAKGLAETFPLEGYRTLYGATKLSSELMIHEFAQFYQVPYVINRCGVLTGPWQMGKVDQGVVVLWMANHFWKRPLSYIGFGGQGKQVRDILHIADLTRLIDEQLHNFIIFGGKTLNVGGGIENSVSLQELTKLCQKITGNTVSISQEETQREGDIRIYITDNSALYSISGWKPLNNIETIAEDIFTWMKTYKSILEPLFT